MRKMLIAILVAVVALTVPVAPVAGQTDDTVAVAAWPPDTAGMAAAAAGPIFASAVRAARMQLSPGEEAFGDAIDVTFFSSWQGSEQGAC